MPTNHGTVWPPVLKFSHRTVKPLGSQGNLPGNKRALPTAAPGDTEGP